MVLRRGLPPVELPLKEAKNIIQFPLPLKTEQATEQVSSLSESSSTKTNTSDSVISHSGSKELEAHFEAEEVLGINGISISKASTSLQNLPMKRIENEHSGTFAEKQSTNGSSKGSSNHISEDFANEVGSMPSISSKGSSERVTMVSASNNEVDFKIAKNLEQFVSFFPELEEAKHYWFPLTSLSGSYDYNSSTDFSQWEDMKEFCSSLSGSMENVETTICCDALVPSCESEEFQSSPKITAANGTLGEKIPIKSAIQFVEEPLPQYISGALSPPSVEPLYSKKASVDRYGIVTTKI